MRVRVLAFARVAEVLGWTEQTIDVGDGASAQTLWHALERAAPQLRALESSTRFARNGRVVRANEALAEGDEIALLPPTGGG